MSPTKFIVVMLGSVLSAGCVTTERETLASGGTPLPNPGSDDTAAPSGGPMNDTGMMGGEGYPPVIESAAASWTEDQNGEWYIEASIIYSDQDDDVREGGMVGVTLVVGDETFATEWLAIDGFSAIHEDEENELRFNPRPPDVTNPSAVSVQATIVLKDAQSNRSEEYPITPG